LTKEISYLFKLAFKQISKYRFFVIFFVLYLTYFYFLYPGETNCLVKRTIGIPCMTCGMTRAFENLFMLNIKEAFYFHPLFLLVPFIGLVFLLQETMFFGKFYHSKLFWGIILLAFIVVYIIRMIMYFPNTEPMEYYSNPLIFRFFNN